MKLYRCLAPYYERFMSHIDYEGEAEAVYRLLFQEHKINGRILDVGAGSGGHLLPLAGMNIKVSGLDYSEEMIALLKKKLSEKHLANKLYTMDMREMSFEHTFDTIYCLGETIHHLADIGEANAFFRCASTALKPGGILIFSWQEPDYFTELLNCGDFYERHGDDYLLWSAECLSEGDDAVDLHYTAFIHQDNNNYERIRETHRLSVFQRRDLTRALKNMGFHRREDLEDLCFNDLLLNEDTRHISVFEKTR